MPDAGTQIECAICGRMNPASASGCAKCGARLYTICRHCSTRNERIAKRCQRCGRKLHRSWWRRRDARWFRTFSPLQALIGLLALVLLVVLLVRSLAPPAKEAPNPAGGAAPTEAGDDNGVNFGR